MQSKSIRVLVVDDSALMRKMATDILSNAGDIEVVGIARNGQEALDKLPILLPDVITLDVEMPVRDGLSTLQEIMKVRPTPVVMLSSLTTAGAETTMKCLHLGAVDFVAKPSGSVSIDLDKVGIELVDKVRVASKTKAGAGARHLATLAAIKPITMARGPVIKVRDRVIIIGSSTGGPRALQTVVPHIPAELGAPMVIVQHLPEAFTGTLANRLNSESSYEVREAKEGDRLAPGVALVAPGGKHLVFDSNAVARLTTDPPIHGVRPAVDVAMASLVNHFGARTVGVLLTGMGKDGAMAMKTIRDKGGATIAEDESTCVVYGMPKAAVELGAVQTLVPLHQVAQSVVDALTKDAKALAS
jgi:two-component system, chemotaxis family, protein-glutamate methylesterase/glutaminase